jgi:hypothetical protein
MQHDVDEWKGYLKDQINLDASFDEETSSEDICVAAAGPLQLIRMPCMLKLWPYRTRSILLIRWAWVRLFLRLTVSI